jgi:HEPN domain-containing protein
MNQLPEDERRGLVRQWIRKAAVDSDLVEHLVSEGAMYPEALGFHSQQAAEKYLKALLVRHQIEVPKTHDIRRILLLLRAIDSNFADSLLPARWLTQFGVEIRYPGDFPDMLPGDAEKAVALMRQVRDAVTNLLDSYLSEGSLSGGSGSPP